LQTSDTAVTVKDCAFLWFLSLHFEVCAWHCIRSEAW